MQLSQLYMLYIYIYTRLYNVVVTPINYDCVCVACIECLAGSCIEIKKVWVTLVLVF